MACRPDMVAFAYKLGEQKMKVRMTELGPTTWRNAKWLGQVQVEVKRLADGKVRVVFRTDNGEEWKQVKSVELKAGETAKLEPGKDVAPGFFGDATSALELTLGA